MSAAPLEAVTFLFTDVEGSTRLWEEHPEAMLAALARHDALLTGGIEGHGGSVVKSRGEGDSFFAVFEKTPNAVAAALAIQQALLLEPWPGPASLRVRMAIHRGDAQKREGDYFGPGVNRCARLRGAAHGGQVLLSGAVAEAARGQLPEGAALADLGLHRLPDLQAPERVVQLLHPALPATFPPLRSLEAFHHNLLVQPSTFIGRERELASVGRLLEGTRLLTLTGAGGCGKTRLALQAAADVLERYPDGVWLVELAGLVDGSLVAQSVAGTLGLREEPDRPLARTLVDALRARSLLLVLDNCEHVVLECARLVAMLLTECPAVRVLATSREALGIAGETAWRVPSLGVPGPHAPARVEEMLDVEAVRLFSERAMAALPDFALSDRNAAAVARVCQRLDGIPLAIELAAARVRVMSVETIAERVDDRFRLLTGGSRAALPRHQTLRAAVDWSYDLLAHSERALLRRLSVFAGGWTLEAAEAIGSDGPDGATGAGPEPAGSGRLDPPDDEGSIPAGEVLDLLTALVEKSLVVFGEGQQERYRLLETVRQYAQERLAASGRTAGFQQRHAEYYLDLAEAAAASDWTADQASWLERLDPEHDNLRAALEWGAGTETELRLAGALWRFWEIRGHTVEARARLDSALAVEGGEPAARARVLTAAGESAWLRGEFDRAEGLHREGLARWREIGCAKGTAIALNGLAAQYYSVHDHERAVPLIEESIRIAREAGEWSVASMALNSLGEVTRARGDRAAARTFYDESLDLARRSGDRRPIIMPSFNLGMLSLNEGDCSRSRALLAEGLALARELRDRRATAAFLEGLAAVYSATGEAERAARLLGAAAALREAMNCPVEVTDRPDFDRTIAATRARLGAAAYDRAWLEGRSMRPARAVDDALQPCGADPAHCSDTR